MCGIIGMNEKDERSVSEAAKLFRYRGPDAFGIFSDDAVTLGHNRLSIIDLDVRSNQPMWDEKREIAIVFNGEIYNFQALREKLADKYHFRTLSDTEVILYLYREYGEEMGKFLSGMFAFAIYDLRKRKLLLFRDHVGIKPLYYFFRDGTFIFSSEIKGIIRIMREKFGESPIDQKAISLYKVFGYIPSPFSLYQDVNKLERASFLVFDLVSKKIEKIGTFRPDVEQTTDMKKFEEILERSILDHLVADVPVGIFFSGGTDSSLLTSVLHRHNIDLETFSLRMSGKKEDETYFQAIAKRLAIKTHVFDFGVKEFDEVYEDIMTNIDEPLSDNSLFPTYYISKKASEYVTVVFSGEGGDEYFFGYPRSKVLYEMRDTKQDSRITFFDRLYFWTPPFYGKNRIFEKIFRFIGSPISYYLVHMSPARDLATMRDWKIAKSEFRKKKVTPMDFDPVFYLENDPLRKTDLATSYNSLEGRVPLLDPRIVYNTKNFDNLHLEGGILKSSLKKILTKYLPKELVYRGKSGFGMDLQKYFRESQYLTSDFLKAIDFLSERKMINVRVSRRNADSLISKYPNFCFSLVALFYSIHNNEKQKF